MTKCLVSIVAAGFCALLVGHAAETKQTTTNFKRELIPALVQSVPSLLKTQNSKTGRFGSGIPVAADQMPIYPLAAAWAIKDPANRYYHDQKLLQAIIRAGNLLADTQDKTGQWEFRKKDNSFWGMHYNPWIYSRWIRSFSLIRDAMPAKDRARWEKALTLGFSGIARRELTRPVNIPAHQAMGLYIAGQALNHPEWCTQASDFLLKVAQAQDTNGFWSEHYGPVVTYNLVYVDALGVYYALSHDDRVLKALESAAKFHANFVYSDGSNIETIDERVPYSETGHLAGLGFSFSPTGRAYLLEQWQRTKDDRTLPIADFLASMLLYGQEGAVGSYPAHGGDSVFVTDDGRASVLRQGSWCAALSAYVCPLSGSRWIQDRQNFISLFHEKTGLILGGGNTKLQPLWSTFTVGDTSLLRHKTGDKNPKFSEPIGLLHIPSAATLEADTNLLTFQYGSVDCSVRLNLLEKNKARLIYTATPSRTTQPVAAHVTFLPAIEKQWQTASGQTGSLTKPFELTAAKAGAWFEHNGWRVQLPEGSRLSWPALRHNPYRDDGRSDLGDGRIVLTLPFSENTTTRDVDVEVLK
ncbi:MAG: hypothetical protein JWM68_2772 [Verrucomicrobiales bacterium]|nr:hypothetical protein [Verrucomicrobiales bacterium]